MSLVKLFGVLNSWGYIVKFWSEFLLRFVLVVWGINIYVVFVLGSNNIKWC